jgi:uncharacterized protein
VSHKSARGGKLGRVQRIALVLLAVACLASCDRGSTNSNEDEGPSLATVIIDRGEKTTLIKAEVAQTPEQRERGLMGRRSLPADEGMAFIFFERTSGGFWMKDTLIPLSIAFFDKDGKILRILDMNPCRKDPCRIYDPGVGYWGALEVNQGAFSRWHAREGDVIRIVQ